MPRFRERQLLVKVRLPRKTRLAAIAALILFPVVAVLAMLGNSASSAPDARYTEASSAYADSNPSWYAAHNICADAAAKDACDHTPWLRAPVKGLKTLTLVEARDRVLQNHSDNKFVSARLQRYGATGGTVKTVDPDRPVWVVESDGPPLFAPSLRPPLPGQPPTSLPPFATHNTVVVDALSGYPISQQIG